MAVLQRQKAGDLWEVGRIINSLIPPDNYRDSEGEGQDLGFSNKKK